MPFIRESSSRTQTQGQIRYYDRDGFVRESSSRTQTYGQIRYYID